MNDIYYRLPEIKEFKNGKKYQRTDGGDWYNKVYDKYQSGDVVLLHRQNRIRVKKNFFLRIIIFLREKVA